MSKSIRKHSKQMRRAERALDANQHAERHWLREVRSRERLKEDLKEASSRLSYDS